MRLNMTPMSTRSVCLAALAASLVGCNVTGAITPPAPFPTGQAKVSKFRAPTEAGTEVAPIVDATKLTSLVAKRASAGSFGIARSDPFALTTMEKYFETQQTTERIFGSGSGFSVQLTPKPDTSEDVVPIEEQPYRRLSGIVVGDSVLAILEEGGVSTIITPGMKIPNTPWTVVSIDTDKAVLRRSGNVRPTQVVVRLETPRDGVQQNPGGNGGGGGFPGGGPGGRPGGFPGGPGGRGKGGMSGDGGEICRKVRTGSEVGVARGALRLHKVRRREI